MRILRIGTERVSVTHSTYGKSHLNIPDLPDNAIVQLTARVTGGGLNPEGQGPLFAPFYQRMGNDLYIFVYDIMANAHTATVNVDYVIAAPA